MSRPHCLNYYNHSSLSRRARCPRPHRWLIVSAFSAWLAGCGASNSFVAQNARRIPVAHISELSEAERTRAFEALPIVFEVRKGDRFPLEVVLDSRLLKIETPGPWNLEALETFYILLREDQPPVISEDGVDFDTKAQNAFSFGFVAKKGQPPKVRLLLALRSKGKAAE
jgi:hypothetical protein